MKIIEASLSHLDELSVLFNDYRMFYRKKSDHSGAKNFLKDRMEKNESVIYVACNQNNEVVGFAQLYPLFSSTRMRRLWLLNDLFIKEEERRRGISKLLIERCKALAMETNAAGLSLETETSNRIGNYLYPSVGFDLDTDHNFYFWTNPNE